MTKRVPPFSAATLTKFKPDPLKVLELVDGAVPGLRVRITLEGTRTWSLNIRSQGRMRRFDVGQGLGLAEARLNTEELRGRIKGGAKPTVEKWMKRQRKELASQGIGTFEAILNEYFNTGPGADLSTRDEQLRRIRSVFAAHLKRTALEVKSSELQLSIDNHGARVSFSCTRDYLNGNPFAGLKAKDILVSGQKDVLKPVQRGRVLDDDEIRSFWNNADNASQHPLTVTVLRLVLLTGQRPGEVTGMHVDEIVGTTWTIPAARRGKSNNAHSVPLGSLALRLIAAAKAEKDRLSNRRSKPQSGYLFEARPGAPISNTTLGKAVTRAALPLEIKHVKPWGRWTPHDLRRTMRTGLSACRIAPHIAELAIGHGKKKLIQTYDQHEFGDEIRHALEAWARRLMLIVGGHSAEQSEPSNVLTLEAAR